MSPTVVFRQWSAMRLGCFTRGQWLLLTFVPLVLFSFNLDGARTLTDHESYVAAPARQMVLDGDWLLPGIGDHRWLEKPPLPHWLAALSSLAAGGFSAGSVRFPFAMAGVGVVLLVAHTMARLFDSRIGFLSGMVQSTIVYMIRHARLADADMLLLFLFMASVAVYLRIVNPADENRNRQFGARLLFWLLIGLMNLVKGLLFGSALALITCVGASLVNRRWSDLRRLWSPTGLVLAAAIGGAWPALILAIEPATRDLWSSHLIGRAMTGIGYEKPAWYYLIVWLEQTLPWTPLLFLSAGGSLQRAWRGPSPDRWIWWWGGSQVVLLSCSAGKHHHYLIYALPAAAPVIAMGILRAADLLARPAIRHRLAFGLAALAAVAAPAGLVAALMMTDYRTDVLILCGLLGFLLPYCAVHYRRNQVRRGFAATFIVICAAHVYVQGVVMPRRDPSARDRRFLSAVEAALPDHQPLYACGGPYIARHLFYCSRPIRGVWRHEDLAGHLESGGQAFVISRARDAHLLRSLGEVEFVMQSERTRSESTPGDRWSLFQITTDDNPAPTGEPPVRMAHSEL